MKISRLNIVLCFAVLMATPCLAHHMAVVVSRENGVENLSSAELGKIFRGDTRKWPDGTEVLLVVHQASNGEALTLQHLNKLTPAQWQGWIRDHKRQLTIVDSDQDVLNFVGNTPGAVGLVDVRSVNHKVKVVHIDGKVPHEEGYLPH